jgi:hypothetical protein
MPCCLIRFNYSKIKIIKIFHIKDLGQTLLDLIRITHIDGLKQIKF